MYANFTISLPVKLAETVERQRGTIARSRYISELIERAITQDMKGEANE